MTLADTVLSSMDLSAKAALVAFQIMIEFWSALESDMHKPR